MQGPRASVNLTATKASPVLSKHAAHGQSYTGSCYTTTWPAYAAFGHLFLELCSHKCAFSRAGHTHRHRRRLSRRNPEHLSACRRASDAEERRAVLTQRAITSPWQEHLLASPSLASCTKPSSPPTPTRPTAHPSLAPRAAIPGLPNALGFGVLYLPEVEAHRLRSWPLPQARDVAAQRDRVGGLHYLVSHGYEWQPGRSVPFGWIGHTANPDEFDMVNNLLDDLSLPRVRNRGSVALASNDPRPVLIWLVDSDNRSLSIRTIPSLDHHWRRLSEPWIESDRSDEEIDTVHGQFSVEHASQQPYSAADFEVGNADDSDSGLSALWADSDTEEE
ncbi:hypothetical protein GGTG_13507 [Gaeumannomyces tritici R3-111a-1]|uniref:Uncharacterized protein n=1 Tax=Gaeumannomyces tritici (strain R3-111a-1) TaxID=644352 RepID=J3PJ25_GAET3|nr:hypothetical protein GGTG_13507 [Gaeumannomyces tritici R3-111a-1]EJT68915.1 hypothetical protein GGTG_13507 [Gaeumannomyces tritici R3-111a-1]